VYVNAVDFCGKYRLAARLRHMRTVSYLGGEFEPDFASIGGVLSAVDVVSGAVRWRYPARRGLVAGVVVTASDLVFTGDLDGNLLAFDALDGTQLLRLPIGSGIGGGLTTYSVAGWQYVAAATGRASTQLPMSDESPARVSVFALPRR
jgi:alcohol dehydrogenase (cytochrome c)